MARKRKPFARRFRRPNLYGLVLLIAVAVAYLAGKGELGGLRERAEGIVRQAREAIPAANMPVTPSAPAPGAFTASAGAPIEVFFAPDPPSSTNGPDDALLGLIAGAQQSVLCAFYDLELESVATALIEKKKAGVRVGVVSDSDYNARAAVRKVMDAKIPVVFDERDAFMHDKFCVVDGKAVWTGSTNVTNNCMFRNDNNAVLVRSEQIAANYTDEFEEMFTSKYFGPRSPAKTPFPIVKMGEVIVENYFAPEDHVQDQIVAQLSYARNTIHFMAYSFTSDPIGVAMIQALQRGVTVRGIFESRNVKEPACEDERLRGAGADIRVDKNSYNMHNKVIVIDSATVITGSFNFSRNAEESNDENVLIINDKAIAGKYVAKFEELAQ